MSASVTRPRFSRIVPQLQAQYRAAAKAGDWPECMRLARVIGNSDRSLAAEAHDAYGYALEQLGQMEEAAAAYQAALFNQHHHAKAQRALTRLRRPEPDS